MDDIVILTGADGFTSMCDSSHVQAERDRRVWAYPIHAVRWQRVGVDGQYRDRCGWRAVKDWIITWP